MIEGFDYTNLQDVLERRLRAPLEAAILAKDLPPLLRLYGCPVMVNGMLAAGRSTARVWISADSVRLQLRSHSEDEVEVQVAIDTVDRDQTTAYRVALACARILTSVVEDVGNSREFKAEADVKGVDRMGLKIEALGMAGEEFVCSATVTAVARVMFG